MTAAVLNSTGKSIMNKSNYSVEMHLLLRVGILLFISKVLLTPHEIRLSQLQSQNELDPRVVVCTAAFHARIRGSARGLGGLEGTENVFTPSTCERLVGSLRDREVACSASGHQGSNFEFCVWRTVSSQSSHHPQEVLLAQFILYVHKGGLKTDSFHLMA